MKALQDHRKELFPCLWDDYHIQNGKLTATCQLLLILSNSLGKTPTGWDNMARTLLHTHRRILYPCLCSEGVRFHRQERTVCDSEGKVSTPGHLGRSGRQITMENDNCVKETCNEPACLSLQFLRHHLYPLIFSMGDESGRLYQLLSWGLGQVGTDHKFSVYWIHVLIYAWNKYVIIGYSILL